MAETSKTVHQALRVLEALRRDGPASASELARRQGTSRTVLLRLLATLEAHDFVRRTGAGFDIGYGVLDIASVLETGIRHAARPSLEALTDRFEETSVLSVRDGSHVVAIDQVVATDKVVRVQYQPGTRHDLTQAAHGRCILAALAAGPDDPDLVAIRSAGYATSHDELEPGVSGLAAAVLDTGGEAIAAVGVVAPTGRMPATNELAPAVTAAAAAVTAALVDRSPNPFLPASAAT